MLYIIIIYLTFIIITSLIVYYKINKKYKNKIELVIDMLKIEKYESAINELELLLKKGKKI